MGHITLYKTLVKAEAEGRILKEFFRVRFYVPRGPPIWIWILVFPKMTKTGC